MTEPQKHTQYQTTVLFAFSFFTASTYVFMRAVSISLFLARIGTERLPIAFAASAFVMIGVSILTRIAVNRIPTKRAAQATWILLAMLTIVFGVIMGTIDESLIALVALYVFAEVRGCLNTIYVVTLSNDAFANSRSKRPYAVVASGAPIAGILVGVIVGIEASAVLVVPAFIATAILDVLTGITVSLFPTDQDPKNHNGSSPENQDGSHRVEFEATEDPNIQNRYRFYLASLVSLKVAVLTLVAYQWKVATGNYFGSNEAQLLTYFAIFYAVSDTAIVLLQWLIAGKLMDRFGIGVGLIGYPFALGLVAILAFNMETPLGVLIAFTIGNGLNVLRRALHDPGLSVAYAVVDPMIRPETIVFVKGMVKPFAEAVAATLLLVLGGLVFELWITLIWFLMTIPWYYFAIKVTRLYQSQWKNAHET